MARTNITFVDHDGEKSTVGVHVPDLTAGNFAAQEALRDAFVSAVEAVSIASRSKTQAVAVESVVAVDFATNPFAQRETKWLVRGRESGTGNAVSFEIPGADLSLLELNGPRLDPASTEYADLVAAVEAYVRSNDNVAITVSEVVHVGRNI